MPRTFAVTFDYLCPFARNAHEHVVTAVKAGADWEVGFLPFSLKQGHPADQKPDIWDRDDAVEQSGIRALLAGIVVRDEFPDRFPDVHLALFAARHDHGADIRDEDVVRDAVSRGGADADAVLGRVASGEPLQTLRKQHEAAIEEHGVFGVPTFVAADDAVFVRFMHRPDGDAGVATATVERTLDLLTGWPELNEFKHTRIPR
jgi:hypothetical protein